MIRSQKGQVTVELVLVMVLLVGIGLFVRRVVFTEGEFIERIVSGPWDQVSGMIENGTFGKPDRTRAIHPGHQARHLSMKGAPE